MKHYCTFEFESELPNARKLFVEHMLDPYSKPEGVEDVTHLEATDIDYAMKQLQFIKDSSACPIANDCAQRAMDGVARLAPFAKEWLVLFNDGGWRVGPLSYESQIAAQVAAKSHFPKVEYKIVAVH